MKPPPVTVPVNVPVGAVTLDVNVPVGLDELNTATCPFEPSMAVGAETFDGRNASTFF